MGNKERVNHWKESAEENLLLAEDMLKLKHYHWCLFHCQLALEKLLKALIVAEAKSIPYTHDLTKLARYANLELSEETVKKLNEITTFSLETRYDDYKRTFYKKATEKFTIKWLKVSKDLYKWLNNQIK